MLPRPEGIYRLAEVRADRQTTRLTLAVAACLFSAFCASIAVVWTSSFQAQVAQTFEILREARVLLSGLQDAETGQRGALLSQRANFLEPYNAAVGMIWPTYQKLRALVAEDPAQLARLDRMSPLIAGKLEELAETLELDRTGRRNEALDRVRSGRGKSIMDQFRAEQAAFSQSELERLQRQQRGLSRSRSIMLATIFLSLAFALILGYLALQSNLSARKLRVRAEQALRESEERHRSIVSTATDAFIVIDEAGLIQSINPAGERMLGYKPNELVGKNVSILMPEPDRSAHDRYLVEYLRTGNAKIIGIGRELRHLRKDGSVFIAELIVTEWQAGGQRYFTGSIRDITERKRHEEQVQLLLREVNHRAKNMLSLVQAVARRTIAASSADFIARFEDRIQALAASQDLLVRNEWVGADLGELVHSQLAHFRDLIGTRIALNGSPLLVTASAAQTLGMALHELATNAGKYGALSNHAGSVAIEWRLNCVEEGKETFVMSWREAGGPPVEAPERRGFGTSILTDVAEGSLDAKVELSFQQGGLAWRLLCPAREVLESRASI